MLVWNYYNTLAIELGAWVCGGSVCGNDQWVGEIYGERLHASRCEFLFLSLASYIGDLLPSPFKRSLLI
jgi:hypothetical protein